jgi:hypothetical protein
MLTGGPVEILNHSEAPWSLQRVDVDPTTFNNFLPQAGQKNMDIVPKQGKKG